MASRSALSLIIVKPYSPDVKPLSIFITGDVDQNPSVVDSPVTSVEAESELPTINENIKKLSGREYQGLLRIVREYNKEKINRQQAMQMLMSGYGLSQEECSAWLGEEELNYN